MAALPALDEPALLDVDVDYLFHTARHRRARPWPNRTPLQWPAALCRELDLRVPHRAAVTIATSLTGGFTPVAWQHLGREIASRLDRAAAAVPFRAFECLEEAAAHLAVGDLARAESACGAAVAAAPSDAAAYVHLAGVRHARGDVDGGRRVFAQALALDPSYRHPFRTRGFWFLRHDRVRDAAAEFADGLALDPGDHHARLGIAMVAIRRRRAAEALEGAEQALGHAESAEAWRTLARAAVLTRDRRRARDAFTRAIRLTLQGEVPLNGPWSANPSRRLADPWHWQDHLELARVLERDGDWPTAMTHYRIAALAAPRARRVRLRLAWTHLRRREWAEAARFARPRWQDLPRWHFN
jgi:tetratricopeptide (TPR) repeat protein